MRYVDDLGKVKPEEIQSVSGKGVIKIEKVNSPYPYSVTFDNGGDSSFTKDGRVLASQKKRHFIFKENVSEPLVKYILVSSNSSHKIFKLNGAVDIGEIPNKEAGELLVNALNEGKISI